MIEKLGIPGCKNVAIVDKVDEIIDELETYKKFFRNHLTNHPGSIRFESSSSGSGPGITVDVPEERREKKSKAEECCDEIWLEISNPEPKMRPFKDGVLRIIKKHIKD